MVNRNQRQFWRVLLKKVTFSGRDIDVGILVTKFLHLTERMFIVGGGGGG
jgi:hypothetical protein